MAFDNGQRDEPLKLTEIRDLLNDPDFLAIEHNLKSTGFFSILGMTHTECWHSAFMAWLLNDNGSHGLGDFAIKRLLIAMASPDKFDDDSSKARKHMPTFDRIETAKFENFHIWPDATVVERRPELTVYLAEEARKIKLSFDVAVAVEMVDEDEGSRRSIALYQREQSQGERRNRSHKNISNIELCQMVLDDERVAAEKELFGNDCEQPTGKPYRALLFLYWPADAEQPAKGRAKSADFRNFTYQQFVDEVLAPCESHPALTDQGRQLIGEYLHNLASPFDEQGLTAIAMSPDERDRVERLQKRHTRTLNFLVEVAGPELAAASEASLPPEGRTTPGNSRVPVTALIKDGLLHVGDWLRFKRRYNLKDVERRVRVGEKGIEVDGEHYDAPSAAAKAILGGQVDRGWDRFRVDMPGTNRHDKWLTDLPRRISCQSKRENGGSRLLAGTPPLHCRGVKAAPSLFLCDRTSIGRRIQPSGGPWRRQSGVRQARLHEME